jgi:uncharacterized protein
MKVSAVVLLLFATVAVADEVTLQTPTGTLYGTLLMPPSSQRVPVVLIISGSGPTDRDGNSALSDGPNNCLRMLAESLAAHGIASLRYDKRGVAASAAALTKDLTFDTEIDDAAGWLRQLRGDVRFSLLIIAGHSQGSLTAMVAARRASADRLISLDGLGRPGGDGLLRQIEQNLFGQFSPAAIDAARKIVASLSAGVPVPNAMVPLELRDLFDQSLQPYLISWFRYDPAAEIARFMVPVLIVHGTTDIQVPVDDAMLLSNANRAAELEIVSGMNHILKDVPNDLDKELRSYSDPTLPIDPNLVLTVSSFISPPLRRRAVP